MRCDACDEPAVADLPYRGAHLCGPHLVDSVHERTRREWHRQLPRFPGGTIAVAVSGGKDSAVALAVTVRHFGRRRNVRVVAISVNEGIAGYRDRTLRAARQLARDLDVEHHVVETESELGVTTDRAAAELPGVVPCSYCGVWRRQAMNRAARDLRADALVLGFNLDDLAQTVLMNLARADLDKLRRMAPHRGRRPGLVPRVAPLAGIPEREVFLYAHLRRLPFDHAECPYAGRAGRNVFRELLWRLEEAIPGSRHSLLRLREGLLPLLEGASTGDGPSACVDCGEPASGTRCRACEYRAALRNRHIALPASVTGSAS